MRNIAIFIFSIVSLVACNSSSQFALDCTITNATQGEMVCLTYPVKHDGIWYKQCDTTYIKTANVTSKAGSMMLYLLV